MMKRKIGAAALLGVLAIGGCTIGMGNSSRLDAAAMSDKPAAEEINWENTADEDVPKLKTEFIHQGEEMDQIRLHIENQSRREVKIAAAGKYNDGISAGDWDCEISEESGGLREVCSRGATGGPAESEEAGLGTMIAIQPGEQKDLQYRLKGGQVTNEPQSFWAFYTLYGQNWYLNKVGEKTGTEQYFFGSCK